MAYKLTPKGESKAIRLDRVDGPESAILTLLYEQKDELEIAEIAGETRMSEGATERVLHHLESDNYVKEV